MDSVVAATLAHLSVGVGGLWLSLIDAREHRLPNRGTGSLALILGCVGLVGASSPDLTRALVCAGASAGFLALLAWIPPRALGWGDVKLQVSLGFYLGLFSPVLVVVQVAGAFVLGGIVALGLVLRGVQRAEDSLAFGPWMVSATVMTYFLGKSVEII